MYSGPGIVCDAYVLVGGRSSRLGRDKAFVPVAGRTLLDRAVAAIREGLGDARVTAVTGPGGVRSPARRPDIPFVCDIYPDLGPLGGLHTALSDAGTEWIFLLACDLPLVSGGLVSLLAGKILDLAESQAAIVPVQPDGRVQPLCAFYKVKEASMVVGRAISTGESTPMHEIVANVDARLVYAAEYRVATRGEDPFLNVNTEADLESAARRLE